MAKRYWGIKTEEPSPAGSSTVQARLGRLAVGSSPRVAKGDVAILFSSIRGDVKFWGIGEIVEDATPAGPAQAIFDESEAQSHWTTVKITDFFEPNRTLSDLAYSLKRVVRPSNHKAHFRRRYVNIDEVDVETIKRNDIHWERAAVGILADALDGDECLEIAPTLLAGTSMSYTEVFRQLKHHVWSHYVSFASLVVETHRLLGEIEDDPIQTIMFVGEDGTDIVGLSALEKICRPVAEATTSEDPLEALLSNETSERLRRVFPVTQDDLLLLLQVR
jgi:hypothetical protein